MSSVTRDALFDGTLPLRQPKSGFRTTIDALLLAAFAVRSSPARLAVDLGSGVGAVALAVRHLGGCRQIACVERDPELAELARGNLAASSATGTVYTLDLAATGLPRELVGAADLVVCNPPYHAPTARRASRHPRQEAARVGDLEPFLRAARAALRERRGRAAFVYPAPSAPALLLAASALGLVPKRLRWVHPRIGEPARLALVELRRARPGGLVVEPPLIEWSRSGTRSAELSALVRGRAVGRR